MSARVATADLSIPRGNDRRFLFTVRDADGNLFDLSGATEIRFAIARSVGATASITKTLGAGVVLADNNTIQVDVTDTESDDLPVGNNYYDIKVTASNSKEYTVLVGNMLVEDVRI